MAEKVLDVCSTGVNQPFVGVDIEDPVPPGQVQGDVACLGEVIGPGVVDQPCPKASGDVGGIVGGSRVDDHRLVDDPGQRRQTVGQKDRLVTHNKCRR